MKGWLVGVLASVSLLGAQDWILQRQAWGNTGGFHQGGAYALHDISGILEVGTAGSSVYLLRGGFYSPETAILRIGDVNADGVLNALDMEALASYLYFHGPAPQPLSRADVNRDGSVNDQDLVALDRELWQKGLRPGRPTVPVNRAVRRVPLR